MKDLVSLKCNEAVCDSLEVAERFNKKHKSIIRNIETLAQNCADVKKMFHKTTYEDSYKRKQPKYFINRDGFSLLVMGFTGKEALEWKLKYIEAFNVMEKLLYEKQSSEWVETRKQSKLTRFTETDIIKVFVDYAKNQGSGHADTYYKSLSALANKTAGIHKRDEATTLQLNNLCLVESIIQQIIYRDMSAGIPYKIIYDNCKNNLKLFSNLMYLSNPVIK